MPSLRRHPIDVAVIQNEVKQLASLHPVEPPTHG